MTYPSNGGVIATIKEVPAGVGISVGDKAFWVKCEPCGHVWAAAYFPMDAMKFARIAQRHAACPKCGERKRVYVAKQDNGVLKEGI